MSNTWSDDAARYLEDRSRCPRCNALLRGSGSCSECAVDLSGPVADALRELSTEAAALLSRRQELVDSLTLVARIAPPPDADSVVVAAGTPERQPHQEAAPDARATVSVQSVLAVAGASLVGVAAIVFTFFNPDLTNFATRTAVVGVVTLVFLGGAWVLSRRNLRFSAEAVGALAVVFVVLDVWAFSQVAPPGTSGWVLAAIGTAVASVLLAAVAVRVHLGVPLISGFIGLSVTPLLLALASASELVLLAGFLAVGVVAFALRFAEPIARGFAGSSRVAGATATTVQLLATAAGVIVLCSMLLSRTVGAAAPIVFFVLAAGAAVATSRELAGLWSALSGVFLALAFTAAVFVLPAPSEDWRTAFVPAAAGIAVFVAGSLFLVRRVGPIRRAAVLGGAGVVALMMSAPAVAFALIGLVTLATSGFVATVLVTSPIGLLALAVCGATASIVIRRSGLSAASSSVVLVVSCWVGAFALLALADWRGITDAIRLLYLLVLSIAMTLYVRLGRPTGHLRVAPITAAHAALVFAAAIAWSVPGLEVAGNIAVLIVLVAAATGVPRHARVIHVGLGYAYALVVLGAAAMNLGADTVVMLSIVSTAASLCALLVTGLRRIGARAWYAVLGVTLVPFGLGIISVLIVRSGWTALSTALMFGLALTLLVTRRAGLNRVVRALAAALLVPSLAVVVVSLGAQVLSISASPITLPVIAAIVGAVFTTIGPIGSALGRRGLAAREVSDARLLIESSAVVTAAIAVLLSLVRSAAGLNITLLVFVILGVGSSLAGTLSRRRMHWIAAAISWTGALWSFWAILGIGVLEVYLLPPALAAALVGAFGMSRDRRARWLFVAGLGLAIVPSTVLVALEGYEPLGAGSLRALALLAGGAVLLVLGGRVLRAGTVLAPLRATALAAAVVAAGGGAIQALRIGLGADLTVFTGETVVLPALGFSLAAAVVASVAGAMLGRPSARTPGSRWFLAPAVFYLVAGPISAIGVGWLPVIATGLLALALLVVMVVSAARGRSERTLLPPVWLLFVFAWVTAVTAWLPRMLRVETFSLPLGMALLLAGILSMRPHPAEQTVNTRSTLDSWPNGFTGSWRVLSPGIVITLLPSIIATGTDPLTWRAILVIALALAAVLVGSLRRLAAPFVLGIVVLPIENAIVFIVQIGRTIGANPWWITLATAGAVLLVIAVTYERNASRSRGVGARLRDLA